MEMGPEAGNLEMLAISRIFSLRELLRLGPTFGKCPKVGTHNLTNTSPEGDRHAWNWLES